MNNNANQSELAGVRELGRTLLRLGWLIVIGCVLGIVAANALTSDAKTYSATARIGLTDDVRWPFFNAAREQVAGLADGLDPAQVLGGRVDPNAFKGIDVTLPPNETFINIQATASDVETALIAADAYAEELVALDTAAPQADLQLASSLTQAEAEIKTLEDTLVIMDADFKVLLDRQAEANASLERTRDRNPSESILTEAILKASTADAAVQIANNERSRVVQRVTSLEVRRDQIQLDIQAAPGTVDVALIRSAVAEDAPGSPLRTRQLLGGLTGAIVFGLLAFVLDRSLGIIRSPAALRSATGLPVIDARSERGAGRLAIWMKRTGQAQIVGFIAGSDWIEAFLQQLQPFLYGSTVIASPPQAVMEVENGTRHPRLMVALGEPTSGHWFDRGIGVCDEVVLLVLTGQQRPSSLQRLLDDVTALGSTVNVVVLLEPWNEPRRSPIRPRQPAKAA